MKKIRYFILLLVVLTASAVHSQASINELVVKKLQQNIRASRIMVHDSITNKAGYIYKSSLGKTDLYVLPKPEGIDIFSSTGNYVTLPLAIDGNSGLMTSADKIKLDSLASATPAPVVDATLEGVLTAGNIANKPLILADLYTDLTNFQGLKLGASSGATNLSNNYGTSINTSGLWLERNSTTLYSNDPINAGRSVQLDLSSNGNYAAFYRNIGAGLEYMNVSGADPTAPEHYTTKFYVDNISSGLTNKVDKVTGKSLILDTEITRLATLANYTHPTNHPPSIITQDTSNRFVTDAEKSTWNDKQTALGYTAENVANKNTANGYAGLGSDGKLISSQLPSITISDTYVVASEVAMLGLTGAEKGDVAVRTDLNKSFILKGNSYSTLADWQELLTPTSAVTTVFGRNGAVTAQTGDYTATMVGAPSGSGTSTGTNTGDQTAITGNAGTATVLQTARTINGVAFNGSTNITVADATKEPSFSKNTAFNKNFGTAISTVAEGNDSRILNGQTAFGWGNHAGLYPSLTGTGANGTWGITISGNAGSATNWGGNTANFSIEAGVINFAAVFDGGVAKYAGVTKFQSWLGLGSNAYSSTAYLPIQDGFRDNIDYDTRLTSGFYNAADSPINRPAGGEFGQLIVARGTDTGFQITGYNNNNMPDMSIRAWGGFGSSFTPWRKIWHDGNFNPANYLPLTGNSTVNGTITATGFFNQSSDRRLKTILKRDGEVAYFTWKDGRDSKTHIGYIAQEVRRKFPDQVQKDEKGMLSVSYIEILVEKVRLLEKRIEELEKK